jgi:Cu/Ag efflux protein CusF
MKNQWKTVIALAIAATTFTAQANEAHHQDASAAVAGKQAAKPAAKPMAASKELDAQLEKMHAVHAKMAAAKTPEERQPPCRKAWP